jgi:hypothetical protein
MRYIAALDSGILAPVLFTLGVDDAMLCLAPTSTLLSVDSFSHTCILCDGVGQNAAYAWQWSFFVPFDTR